MGRRTTRGFTLVEMLIVVAIIGVIASLAVSAFYRERPDSTLRSVAVELESTFRLARQEALSRGTSVAVLVFPKQGEDEEHRGRVFILQDEPVGMGDSFFNPAQDPSFESFDPAAPAATPNGQILDTVDLPRGVLVGPETGMAGDPLPFPYAAIDTGVACSFCSLSDDERGAVVFDARGRATFYRLAGGTIAQAPTTTAGESLTVHHVRLAESGEDRTATLVITSPQGMVRSIYHE